MTRRSHILSANFCWSGRPDCAAVSFYASEAGAAQRHVKRPRVVPTIELISIGCPEKPALPRYDGFAFIVEKELRSHRGLFQSVFDTLNGVIVHLANKDMEGYEDGCWFAGMIMDWQEDETEDEALVFLPDTLLDVRDLMQRLLAASPEHRITFSTDYQFGSERRECGEILFSRFFDLHARRELRYNHLWYVKPDS